MHIHIHIHIDIHTRVLPLFRSRESSQKVAAARDHFLAATLKHRFVKCIAMKCVGSFDCLLDRLFGYLVRCSSDDDRFVVRLYFENDLFEFVCFVIYWLVSRRIVELLVRAIDELFVQLRVELFARLFRQLFVRLFVQLV